MAGVWIVADQRGNGFRKVIFEMLGEGKKIADKLGEDLSAVVIGKDIGSLAGTLGEYGAQKVYLVDHPSLEQYTTDGYAQALTQLAKEHTPSVILFAHAAIGKDLAPTVAQRLNTGQCSDVIQISYDGDLTFKRPIYAGKALTDVSFNEGVSPFIVTMRPKAFEALEPQSGASPEVINFNPTLSEDDLRQKVKDVVRKASGRVELTEADIVISGGRGMKSKEGFAKLEELADILGAAVGASRAAVDEGWLETQFQVGQTGKIVSPSLYIAFGISGAIQHLAGMNSSKVIVAVNKDPEAEIFKVADYGIVADIKDVLPVMVDEFKKAMADA